MNGAMLVSGFFWFATSLCFAALGGTTGLVCNDLDGIAHHPFESGGKAGSVLIFYWHDCPVCNSYAPEINRLYAGYTNFSFYIVQIDPDLTSEGAKEHAKQYELRPPVLLDSGHRLVKLAKATVTPEAVVFGKDRQILYRGRIDDLYAAIGKRRPAATHHDLIDALNAIGSGNRVKKSETKVIGCLIPK